MLELGNEPGSPILFCLIFPRAGPIRNDGGQSYNYELTIWRVPPCPSNNTPLKSNIGPASHPGFLIVAISLGDFDKVFLTTQF
jgi:hypothetical protein